MISDETFEEMIRIYYDLWRDISPVLPRMSVKYHDEKCKCAACLEFLGSKEEYWSSTGIIHMKFPKYRGNVFMKAIELHENRHWVDMPYGYPQNDLHALADAAYLVENRLKDAKRTDVQKVNLALHYGNILGDYIIHYMMAKQHPDLFKELYKLLVGKGPGHSSVMFDLYVAAYAPLIFDVDPPTGPFHKPAIEIANIIRRVVEAKIDTRTALVELYDIFSEVAGWNGLGDIVCPECGGKKISARITLKKTTGGQTWARVTYRCKDCGHEWESAGVLVSGGGLGGLNVEIEDVHWEDDVGTIPDIAKVQKKGKCPLMPDNSLKGKSDATTTDPADAVSKLPTKGMDKEFAEQVLGQKIDTETWNEGLMKSILREFLEKDIILDEIKGKADMVRGGVIPWQQGDSMESIDIEATSEIAEMTGLGMIPEITMRKREMVPRGRGYYTFKGARIIVLVDTSDSMFTKDTAPKFKAEFAVKFCKYIDDIGKRLGFQRTYISFSNEAMRTDDYKRLRAFKNATELSQGFRLIKGDEFDRANIVIISDAEIQDFKAMEEQIKQLLGKVMSFKIITLAEEGDNRNDRKKLRKLFEGTKIRDIHMEIRKDGTLERLGEL